MNRTLFDIIFEFSNRWSTYDEIVIFCAHWLVYIVFAIGGICVAVTLYRRQWSSAAYAAAALAVTFGLTRIMALIHTSNRPFVDLDFTPLVAHAANSSFPSDHTAAAFAVALSVLIFLRYRLIGALLLIAAFFVGYGRIAVGVHYPYDIAGSIIASLITIIAAVIARRFITPPMSNVRFDRKS